MLLAAGFTVLDVLLAAPFLVVSAVAGLPLAPVLVAFAGAGAAALARSGVERRFLERRVRECTSAPANSV